MSEEDFSLQSYLVPYEPSATIRLSAILFPRTKVMTTYKNAGWYMRDEK